MPARVSLAELSAAGVRLTPADAAAIVTEICRQITDGVLRGVPSAHVIRFHEDGRLTSEGPVGADRATVAHAAKLLESLLSDGQRSGEYRMPGPLRLVLARAQGTLDLPPYAGLDEFCAAVTRFATADLRSAARELYASWKGATAPPPSSAAGETLLPTPVGSTHLTISDVRRARRATGLTLADVAERSRVPSALLLELEWGYLRNWPAGFYGRAQLVRYARAAGLDDRLVLQAAWPLLEEAVEARGGDAVVPSPATRPLEEAVPAYADDDIVVDAVPLLRAVPFPTQPAPRRPRWIAALAILAAIALALVPAAIEHERHLGPARAVSNAQNHQLRADAQPAPPAPILRVPAPRRFTDEAAAPPPAIRENASYSPSPSFSSAGTATFFRDETDGSRVPTRADGAEGSVLKITRIVDGNARNFHARPSPDGRLIAFDSDRDGTRGVYVATARGTDVRRVSGDGFGAVPSWSPDSRQLAFVKAEPVNPRVWNLWTVDVATGEQRRLTSDTAGQPWGGSWFPDGRRIAYGHETDLVVLDLVTGHRRVYPTPLAGRVVQTPSVSPDGRRIIFQVYRAGAWLLDVERGTMRRVLDDPSAEDYTWSPDGHRVAFHSHRTGGWGVWVVGQ